MNPFISFVFSIFLVSAAIITMYTCNLYYLAFLASRRNDALKLADIGEPTITVQIPIYNEKYVAARLVDAVCAMDYPKEKMRILVLDDSDDDTVDLMRDAVSRYQNQGFDIRHVRRGTREGYKAGALRHSMEMVDTDFVAIFDADFIPPEWFLRRALPHFAKPDIGLVQCRWGHVNENYSPITQAQALSLDFHFLIEQKAKSNSHYFMNFNGTAGIWRRDCIEKAGGWHTATLVEDLDLSYRAQMGGWKCLFLQDIVVDAELPVQMNAAKRQQYRWAKGSIQCAVKLLSNILVRRNISLGAKSQAFVQLTRHVVYPFMLVQFLALPILLAAHADVYLIRFLPALTLALYLAMGPIASLLIMQTMYGRSWRSKAKILPVLIIYNTGMAVNNTVAVFDAVLGKRNEFLRTPKYGIVKNSEDWRDKAYNLPFTKVTLLEMFFAVYGVLGIFVSLFSNNAVFAPIIAVQTLGFLCVVYLSLAHSKRVKVKRTAPPTREERMAHMSYRMALTAIILVITAGVAFSLYGYYLDVYPLDLARGHLAAIVSSSDASDIMERIALAKESLPDSGNPVWIFATSNTDFGRMQDDLSYMMYYSGQISPMPVDSTAYATAMLNLDEMARELRSNITDATPYVYVSQQNILLSAIWVAAIIGIFAALKRKREEISVDSGV